MLNESGEIRLFGLRYRTILLILLGLAAAIILMMAVTVPSVPAAEAPTGAMEEMMGRFRNTWIRLLVLSSFLGIVLTAVLLTVFSYFSTRQRLSRIRTTARAILESLAGGVLTMDIDGNITIINRAASEILELPSQAPYPDLESLSSRHPRLAQVIRQALCEIAYVQDDDVDFVNSAGVKLVLRTTVSAQLDETGRRVGLVVLVKDVSRMVAMEKELRRKDRLAAAGTLAAGVAHEINNPIGIIAGYAQFTLEQLKKNPNDAGAAEAAKALTTISEEAFRCKQIVQKLLTLARPGAGRRAVGWRGGGGGGGGWVGGGLKDYRERELKLHVQEGVDVNVLANEGEMKQVVLNLALNALEATEPARGRVDIRVRRAEQFAELVVEDNGRGMTPAVLERVFEPFFTAKRGAMRPGTGLGLSIVHAIVENHGGEVSAHSAGIGQGSRFTVRLPAARSG
jgi:signal transduction histidine kinase